jgi:hypothetical protein
MISVREQVQIRLLSDNNLYPQAVEFMKSIDRPLPPTQINGLLNVSLANPYDQLKLFVERQCTRTTWASRDRHIPDFYRKFTQKLKHLETYVPSITKHRQGKVPREDELAITMELAREFIQHILAENAYRGTMNDFDIVNGNRDQNPSRNQGKSYNREGKRQ